MQFMIIIRNVKPFLIQKKTHLNCVLVLSQVLYKCTTEMLPLDLKQMLVSGIAICMYTRFMILVGNDLFVFSIFFSSMRLFPPTSKRYYFYKTFFSTYDGIVFIFIILVFFCCLSCIFFVSVFRVLSICKSRLKIRCSFILLYLHLKKNR